MTAPVNRIELERDFIHRVEEAEVIAHQLDDKMALSKQPPKKSRDPRKLIKQIVVEPVKLKKEIEKLKKELFSKLKEVEKAESVIHPTHKKSTLTEKVNAVYEKIKSKPKTAYPPLMGITHPLEKVIETWHIERLEDESVSIHKEGLKLFTKERLIKVSDADDNDSAARKFINHVKCYLQKIQDFALSQPIKSKTEIEARWLAKGLTEEAICLAAVQLALTKLGVPVSYEEFETSSFVRNKESATRMELKLRKRNQLPSLKDVEYLTSQYPLMKSQARRVRDLLGIKPGQSTIDPLMNNILIKTGQREAVLTTFSHIEAFRNSCRQIRNKLSNWEKTVQDASEGISRQSSKQNNEMSKLVERAEQFNKKVQAQKEVGLRDNKLVGELHHLEDFGRKFPKKVTDSIGEIKPYQSTKTKVKLKPIPRIRMQLRKLGKKIKSLFTLKKDPIKNLVAEANALHTDWQKVYNEALQVGPIRMTGAQVTQATDPNKPQNTLNTVRQTILVIDKNVPPS